MIEILEELKEFFHGEEFPIKPTARYISLVILRETQSEAIFRTDEMLSKELTNLSFSNNEEVSRVILTKRKVIAPERRTGREFLRAYNLIPEDCNINGSMCGECIDCLTYGFAGAEQSEKSKGALKSRVLSENSYSVLPASEITDIRTINALSELGTMMEVSENKKGEKEFTMRQSLASNEYVKPGVHFVDIETLHDIRNVEFVYVLGNIMLTKRYGAISSRIGKISNEILAIVGSNSEIFSTLELVKATYDKLDNTSHPLNKEDVKKATMEAFNDLMKKHFVKHSILIGQELENLLEEVRKIYKDPKPFAEEIKKLKGWND